MFPILFQDQLGQIVFEEVLHLNEEGNTNFCLRSVTDQMENLIKVMRCRQHRYPLLRLLAGGADQTWHYPS